jgi:hypothetical protein
MSTREWRLDSDGYGMWHEIRLGLLLVDLL